MAWPTQKSKNKYLNLMVLQAFFWDSFDTKDTASNNGRNAPMVGILFRFLPGNFALAHTMDIPPDATAFVHSTIRHLASKIL